MSARYWVLISDALMDSDPEFPATFRAIERGTAEFPGSCWWLCEDDDAPETLNGKRVDLILQRVDGKPVIAGRRPSP